MTIDDKHLDAPAPDGLGHPPVKMPTRWRTIAAVVATVTIIALFALLLRGFVAGKGAPGPAGAISTQTATHNTHPQATQAVGIPHGQWHTVDAMTYTTQTFTQAMYPAFSPKDPSIVYEATLAPITVRRSDNGGATWRALSLPRGSDQAIDIEIFPSPLDAHAAFLTVTVNLAYGQGPSSCPTSTLASAAGATHGNIQASGQVPCSTTYRTTDEGKTWTAITFPVNGTISTPLSDSAPYAGTPIQAQGTRLYAMLDCGPTCSSPGARLVASANGGVTWHVADSGLNGICDFAAQPAGQTVFVAASTGGCDMLNSPSPSLPLYRSDSAGAGWSLVGALPQGAVQGMKAVTVGGKALLVINLPKVTWQPHLINVTQSADEFYVSSDGGHHWQESPLKGVPAQARPVVSPLIVRADGSLIVAFPGSATGEGAVIYTWKPGQATWREFAPAPQGQLTSLLHTVSSTGGETFWAVVNSATVQQTNNTAFTYTISSYQP